MTPRTGRTSTVSSLIERSVSITSIYALAFESEKGPIWKEYSEEVWWLRDNKNEIYLGS